MKSHHIILYLGIYFYTFILAAYTFVRKSLPYTTIIKILKNWVTNTKINAFDYEYRINEIILNENPVFILSTLMLNKHISQKALHQLNIRAQTELY